jgi:YidC/Oxa1 family membrane protein insertase
MDRTGKLILFGSVALLIASFIFQSRKASQRSVQRRDDANSTKQGTSPPPVISSPTNASTAQTNTVPQPQFTNAVPSAPEKTVVLQNDFVRYTFTTHGGGIKRVELKKFPKEPGKEIAEVGMEEMHLDRGRLPLLAFQPSDVQVDYGPTGKRPYSTASTVHKIVSPTGKSVTLEVSLPSPNGGSRLVRKVFTIGRQYQLDVAVSVSNNSTNNLAVAEADFFLVSGTAQEPLSKSRMMGMSYGTMWFNGDEEQSVGPGYFDNKPLGCMCIPGGNPRNNYQGGSGKVKWVGAYSRFFIQALIPAEQGGAININEFRLQALKPKEAANHDTKVTNNQMAYETALKVRVPSMVPGAYPKTFKYTLYTGPREYDRLAQIGRERENRFELIMDFGGWFGWVAEGLLRVMKWFHGMGLSYAMAIIAITFIIKLIFWPITARSTRAMKKMAAVNAKMMPEVKDIRERYKDDYQKMNMKMMETYKKYGVNPLSQMGGCLPMVIQLPIFFGFFTMLRTAIELRGAEFLWVSDLSSPENLFADTLGFPINIMPLLMTGTMFLQMRLQPPSPGMDPTQQAMMKYMPLMFVFFFYFASAGLCLYWTVSNVLGIVQTKMTKIEPVKDNVVEVIPPTKKKRKT